MKKLITAIFAAGLLGSGLAWATDNIAPPESDIVTWGIQGTSNTAVAVSSEGRLNSPDGIVSIHEQWESPAISTTAVFTAAVTTTALATGASTFITGFTQPSYPTALVLGLTLGATTFNATQTITTVTVGGFNAQGSSVTEAVVITTMAPAGVTNHAYAKISYLSFSKFNVFVATESGTVYLAVGSTATFGLSGDIGQTADVYKVRAYAVDSTSFTANAQYDTLKLNNVSGTGTTDAWFRNTRSPRKRQ